MGMEYHQMGSVRKGFSELVVYFSGGLNDGKDPAMWARAFQIKALKWEVLWCVQVAKRPVWLECLSKEEEWQRSSQRDGEWPCHGQVLLYLF